MITKGRSGTSFSQIYGISTGTLEKCSMHGCNGKRVHVKWPDGKLTKPCSKGLIAGPEFNSLRIN